MPTKFNVPKIVSMEVDLDKETPAIASVSEFRGKLYLSLRYTYQDHNTGETRMAKNGISVPLEFGKDAIRALVDAYNESTGEHIMINDPSVPAMRE
jgi:hypothetical protein